MSLRTLAMAVRTVKRGRCFRSSLRRLCRLVAPDRRNRRGHGRSHGKRRHRCRDALPLVAGGIAVYKDDWIGMGQLGVDGRRHGRHRLGAQEYRARAAPGQKRLSVLPVRHGGAGGARAPAFCGRAMAGNMACRRWRSPNSSPIAGCEAKKHHWYDTLASSGIACGLCLYLRPPATASRGTFIPRCRPSPDSAYFHLTYNF